MMVPNGSVLEHHVSQQSKKTESMTKQNVSPIHLSNPTFFPLIYWFVYAISQIFFFTLTELFFCHDLRVKPQLYQTLHTYSWQISNSKANWPQEWRQKVCKTRQKLCFMISSNLFVCKTPLSLSCYLFSKLRHSDLFDFQLASLITRMFYPGDSQYGGSKPIMESTEDLRGRNTF